MYFEKYVGEEITLLQDGSDNLIIGRLIEIIPREIGENGETLVVDCSGIERKIPTVEIMQFFSNNELANDDTEFYYVIFRYGKTERSREHIYMSYDYSVKPGDRILLWKDWNYVGNVIRTGFYKRNNAPYPPEKTWFIQSKVYDRIDFMKYDDSCAVIQEDNLYKDNYLNEENSYKQFVAKVDYQYQWVADSNIDDLENEKWKPKQTDHDTMKNYTIGMCTDFFTQYWPETNQIDIFYTSLWMCSYIAKYGGYDKYLFDRYVCLSLIYKHGDFDDFLFAPKYDKLNIEREIAFLDDYISKIVTA